MYMTIKGIYINDFNRINLLTLTDYINKCVLLNMNAVVIDIFKNDDKIFSSSINIKKLKLLKEKNIYIICRIVVFPENIPFSLNLVYLDSIIQLINFISRFNLVDEIQLDYIRFPVNYYLLTTKKKTEIIQNVIKYILQKKNKIKISLDLFGWVLINNNSIRVGQNINFTSMVDFVSPMIYPSHWGNKFHTIKNPKDYPYELIDLVITQHINRNGIKYINKIRPYITGWNCDKKYIYTQIQALKDNNINSYLIWVTDINSTLNAMLMSTI